MNITNLEGTDIEGSTLNIIDAPSINQKRFKPSDYVNKEALIKHLQFKIDLLPSIKESVSAALVLDDIKRYLEEGEFDL